MNVKKYIKNTALAMAIVLSTTSIAFAANTYSDVGTDHWAYSSILKVAEKGIMVGDGSNYYPNQVLDKLEAARILARVAGYNASTGFSPTSSTQTTINMYKKAFPKRWGTLNKDYENSIAYLYQKEVLTMSDLDKFVIKLLDGTEKVNNLSRQEMAMYIVKTMGKKNEAISYKGNFKFADDVNISEVAKPYVYYLKNLGVITADSSNYFDPNSSITKAQMAVFLDRAIYSKDSVNVSVDNKNNAPNTTTVTPTTTTNTTTTTQTNQPQNVSVTSEEGKITNVYASSSVIGITASTGQIRVYRVASNAKVYLDGFASSLDKLTANMPVIAVIMNNEAVEIRAQKITIAANGQLNNINTNTNINTSTNTNTNTNTNVTTPVIDNSQLITRICTVASTGNINNANTLTVNVQLLNPSGDIYKEEQSFILANNCTITRAGKNISLSTIEKNDIVTIKFNGSYVYSIAVEEKDMTITEAELIEKRLNDENVPILTIKTKDGTEYELKVLSSSDLRRKGDGDVKWKELRIGDTIEVDKQYNNIVSLYATGKTSTVEGWVDEMVISSDSSSVTLRDTYGEKTKYSVFSASDLYSISLNSKVKLMLDSKEVSSIRVLSAAVNSNSIQGTVDSSRSSYMYINTDQGRSIRITFDNNTTVYDAVSDKAITTGDIVSDMYVNVIFTNNTDKIAKRVTIISK